MPDRLSPELKARIDAESKALQALSDEDREQKLDILAIKYGSIVAEEIRQAAIDAAPNVVRLQPTSIDDPDRDKPA